MKLEFKKPIAGIYQDIHKAPDDVFSKGMLGPGFAVIPSDHKIYAPFDGKVVVLFPTKHAIAIENMDGVKVLFHIGLGTGKLEGVGFNLNVVLNQHVQKGDLLMSFDLPFITKSADSNNVLIAFVQKKSLKVLELEHDVYTLDLN